MTPIRSNLRSVLRVASLAFLVAGSVVHPAPAQNEANEDRAQEQFSSEERVTVVEVQVQAPEKLFGRWKRSSTPSESGLSARLGGVPVEIVGLTLPEPSELPWSQLLYFDAPLSAAGTIPWAAKLLAARAAELADLGPVHIVVADPVPRLLIGPTRDPEAIDLALSGLALDDPGEGVLTQLRQEFHQALEGLDLEGPESDRSIQIEELERFAEAIWTEETRFVQSRQDTLLATIADSLVPVETPNSRRLLYWISSGFDLEAEDAYGLNEAESDLAAATEGFVRSIAAYGWTTLSLLRPEPKPPLLPGIRIGKLRITGFGIKKAADTSGRGDEPYMPTISATWEEDREPERARGFLELGRARVAEGRPKKAEDSFRQAIRFFHGDPRTSAEQAEAWEQLAGVLEQLQRPEEARRAFEQVERLQAVTLERRKGPEPELPAIESLVFNSRIRHPEIPLEALAEATAGQVVRHESALSRALEALTERFLISMQFPGLPSGEIEALELIVGATPQTLLYPKWLRQGTSERVAEARVRLLFDETLEPDPGGFLVTVESIERTPQRLSVKLSTPGLASAGGRHRLSLALVDDQGNVDTHHFTADTLEGSSLGDIPASEADGLLVAIVEDLVTGSWGAVLEDLPQVDAPNLDDS